MRAKSFLPTYNQLKDQLEKLRYVVVVVVVVVVIIIIIIIIITIITSVLQPGSRLDSPDGALFLHLLRFLDTSYFPV
jgi:type IV secretory pathway VirB6-like protein